MDHALPTFENVLSRCPFRNPPSAVSEDHSDVEPVILDPLTTHRVGLADQVDSSSGCINCDRLGLLQLHLLLI